MKIKSRHIKYWLIKSTLLSMLLTYSFFTFSEELSSNKEKFDLHSINFVQKSIDVSKADESLYFSLKAYSQLGLNTVNIYFESPSGEEIIQTSCTNKKKTKVGLLLGRILFKKKSESGVWKINKIVIEDLNGNLKTFDKAFLIENKFTHTLQINSGKLRR